MPPLKEIPRSARVAWCPATSHKTVLALGGRGLGAQLEFVDVDLSDPSRRGFHGVLSVDIGGTPIGSLAWANSADAVPDSLGFLAAGFDDGTVKVWDSAELLEEATLVAEGAEGDYQRAVPVVTEVPGKSLLAAVGYDHPVSCLDFNVVRPTLVAAGYKDGMMNIINLDNAGVPEVYEPGAEPTKVHGNGCVTAVAWNRGVQHILASTSYNGSTTIWNLRQKKPSIRFRDPAGRLCPSSVAWVPNQATQVVVAYDDDTNPSFQMWDLRNASYPFKEFPGHTRGIVEIQFSELDPCLMLSSGKDNRVVTWALDDQGVAPTIFSEIAAPEWQDSVRWSPGLPGLIAATSHIDGVLIESVQTRRNPATKHVPRWHHRPAGASFGFGGKLVSFNESTGTIVRCDVIPSTDPELIREADDFEAVLVHGDYLGYCERRIHEAEDEHERLTWQVVQTLFYPPEHRAGALLDKLGFRATEVLNSVEAFLGRKPGSLLTEMEFAAPMMGAQEMVNGYEAQMMGGNVMEDNVSSMLNQSVDAETFFNNLEEKDAGTGGEQGTMMTSTVAGDTVLGSVHSAPLVSRSGGLEQPPRLSMDYRDYSSGADLLIKKSLLVGQRLVATEMCIEADRWADALLLAATSGNQSLWQKTQNLYFRRKAGDKFLQLVGCLVNDNWDELVKQADLSKWEETLALLANYLPAEELPALALDLGLRLEKERFDIRSAVVCYLAAGNFSHAATVWSSLSVSGNRGKSVSRGLQDLVQKLAVLKRATGYEMDDPLFNQRVSQYAEVLANSGRLVAGMKFLSLVGREPVDPTAGSTTGILRERIYNAAPDAMAQAGIAPPSTQAFTPIDVVSSLPQPGPTRTQTQAYGHGAPYAAFGGQPIQPGGNMAARPDAYGQPRPDGYGQQTAYGYPPQSGPQPPQPSSSWAGVQASSSSTRPSSGALGYHDPYSPKGAIPYAPDARPLPTAGLVRPFTSMDSRRPPSGPPDPQIRAPPQQMRPLAPRPPPAGHAPPQAFPRGPPQGPLAALAPSSALGGPPGQFPLYSRQSSDTFSTSARSVAGVRAPPKAQLQAIGAPPPPMSSRPPAVFMARPSDPQQFSMDVPPPSPPEQQLPPPQQAHFPSPQQFTQAPPAASQQLPVSYGASHPPSAPYSAPQPPSEAYSGPQRPVGLAQPYSAYPAAQGGGYDAQPAAPLAKSTAPTAGVVHVPHGMPVPWPIPTGTQQVGSTTQTTASANHKIQTATSGKDDYFPMTRNDIAFVQRVLFSALDIQAQHDPTNPKRHDECRQKLSTLITQLQDGTITKQSQDLIMQYCRALEVGDLTAASHIQGQLARKSWAREARGWLIAIKRLLVK